MRTYKHLIVQVKDCLLRVTIKETRTSAGTTFLQFLGQMSAAFIARRQIAIGRILGSVLGGQILKVRGLETTVALDIIAVVLIEHLQINPVEEVM